MNFRRHYILRGASVVEGPIDRVYGMREVIVEDCHGLRLAFGEDPASRDVPPASRDERLTCE